MNEGARPADRHAPNDTRRLILAALFPLVACGLQLLFWSAIQPFVWFLFYPAVFFSSWVGGLSGGLVATVLSTVLVWYCFIPPQFSFAVQCPMTFLSIVTFMGMGVLFSLFHGRLRKANQQAAEALAAARLARDEFEAQILKRTAEELRESRAKLESALASMTDAVFISDAQGQFINFNDAFATFHRFKNKDQCAKRFAEYPDILDVFLPNGEPAPVELWAVSRALRGETATNVEYTLRRKDSGETWVGSYSFAPIRDKDGTIVGSVVTGRDITERKRAEEALQKQNRFIQTILDHAPIGFAVNTINDGAFQYVNARFEEIYGVPRGALRSVENFFDLVYPDPVYREELRGRIMADIASGDPARMCWEDVPFTTRTGESKVVTAVNIPVLDQNLMVSTVMDVTRRKRAEAALRESEARLRSLGDNLPDSYVYQYIHEADGSPRFLYLSAGVEKLHGVKVSDVLRDAGVLQRQTASEQLPAVAAGEAASRQTLTDFEMELRMRGSAGQWRWFHVRSRPRRQPDGQVLWDGVATDITARKAAEETIRQLNVELEQRVIERTAQLENANTDLRHSQAELQSLFESLPGLYLVLTPDLKIVAASDAYLKATLTTREGILGHSLFDVFPDNPDDAGTKAVANMQASIDRVMRNAAPDTMAIARHDIRGPDGVFVERYWSPINSPMFGTDREIKYIIHRVEEVTEYVRQKSRSVDKSSAFDARIEQMEAEVFQGAQKVRAANQQLEIANKELEAFSYSVSHDLRAPLRHVLGYVEMLAQEVGDQLSQEGRRYLKTITDASKEMGELIDDLLAFSRMGRAEMREVSVELGTLVQKTLRDLESAMSGRNIVWTIPPLPAVHGDPAMLKQVLANLLGNAVKYSRPRDPAQIEVGCAGEEDGRIILFVRDNGVGFDPQYAHKLFGVFQRLHRADQFEGTGIGLANVHRIVARHGGRTWAESKVNEGATFYFTLKPASDPVKGKEQIP
jgi:PAS domain S-box-containing protein